MKAYSPQKTQSKGFHAVWGIAEERAVDARITFSKQRFWDACLYYIFPMWVLQDISA